MQASLYRQCPISACFATAFYIERGGHDIDAARQALVFFSRSECPDVSLPEQLVRLGTKLSLISGELEDYEFAADASSFWTCLKKFAKNESLDWDEIDKRSRISALAKLLCEPLTAAAKKQVRLMVEALPHPEYDYDEDDRGFRIGLCNLIAEACVGQPMVTQLVTMIVALESFHGRICEEDNPYFMDEYASMLEYFRSHLGELVIYEKLDWEKIIDDAKMIISRDPYGVRSVVLERLGSGKPMIL